MDSSKGSDRGSKVRLSWPTQIQLTTKTPSFIRCFQAPTPTSQNTNKKNPKRSSTVSLENLSTDPLQFLNGTIKCTCSHGDSLCLQAQTNRKPPIHPMHGEEGKRVKQLNQFPPNDLEMIHVSPARYDRDEGDGRGGRYPENGLLCYQSGSACGLGHQTRETMKFP